MNWEPISTYPFNKKGEGDRVLIYAPNIKKHIDRIVIASGYKFEDDEIDWHSDVFVIFKPTHWMHLPEKPS